MASKISTTAASPVGRAQLANATSAREPPASVMPVPVEPRDADVSNETL
jgi:hypothetical protein